jgi:hypothetical protein
VADSQSIVIALEQLDGIAAAVDEDEHAATGDLASHVFTHQSA